MKMPTLTGRLAAFLLLVLVGGAGCESTDGGGGSASGNMYYGVGFYDPWYHGNYDYDYDIVVTPPDRPGSGLHPSHPIARPPDVSARPPAASTRPVARPMPSIPSTPRMAPRGGGGRRR